MMNLNIVSLQGNKYLLNIDLNKTILDVKNELSKKIDIIPERLKLIYCGQLLEDNKTIKEYQIQKQSFIHLVIIDEREYWEKIISQRLSEAFNEQKAAFEEETKKIKELTKKIKKLNEKKMFDEQKNELIRLKDILLNSKDNNGIIQHKMIVHLRHTQDWSYGIKYNILQNKSQSKTGSGSPGVIEGIFPRHKIPYIKKIDIINVKNTLTIIGQETKPAGNSRSISVDINGNLWAETPYGHRMGANVTWDSYIDIIILFENKNIKVNWSLFNPKDPKYKGLSAHDLAREFYRSQHPDILEIVRNDKSLHYEIDNFLGYPGQWLCLRR